MGLIDSHAHLTDERFRDCIGEVLDRAADAGVEHVISIATDMADAGRVLDLARTDDRVSAAVGIHPHEAAKATRSDWARYESLIHNSSLVALGEMGLDYHYDFSDQPTQQHVFERQLEIALSTDLPIVIHSREAHDDTVATLTRHGYVGRPVVFHCFTGTSEHAAEIADNGWRISFTGVVTFKNSGALQLIARDYPIDRLMVETDSPYLSPAPVRHIRPNEPAHLAHTARFLAALCDMTLEEFKAWTSRISEHVALDGWDAMFRWSDAQRRVGAAATRMEPGRG